MSEHESFLRRLEDTLGRVSGWLAVPRHEGEQPEPGERHARIEAIRREIAQTRGAIGETVREDLARVRASLDDLRRDYDVPPPRTALTRAELEAFRRHLHTTARLLRDLSVADSPTWAKADEDYERSWAEVERAFESPRGPASRP